MLTKTQRDWAQAQVGEERVTAVTGMVMDSRPGSKKDEKILDVSGEHGAVEFTVSAPDAVIAEMKKVETTVRLEGTVTGVQLDEENGRVGLEIAGESGSTVEWVVPEMSTAEKEANELELLETAKRNKTQREEEERKTEQLRLEEESKASLIRLENENSRIKDRLIFLINEDPDVRAALNDSRL